MSRFSGLNLKTCFVLRNNGPLLFEKSGTGKRQGGMIAATYHLIYVVLFFLLGFGLYRARAWAYKIVFVVTGLYTLDRLVYVLDKKALERYLLATLGFHQPANDNEYAKTDV